MIYRASQLFLPTLRDDPADAEAASHRLLVRGGYIRQVSAGVWTFLPLGWRVHEKIVQIIREEMNAIGGQEMLMPVLTPAELWETTGRIKIPEIFHIQDRTGRHFILPMTHEETFTFHAREIRSYKELPQLWYHFAVKDRDEPRPRGGLLRVREFIMKDAYSFDRDEDGVKRSVEAPGVTTCEALAEFLGVDLAATSKAMPVVKEDGTLVLALLRGDDRLSETKLYDALPGGSRPATGEEIRAGFGAGGGSLGPVGFAGEVLADDTLREGQFVAGANRDGWHARGVEAGRDFEARFADLREPREGDRCPVCGGALEFRIAVEVGHIFNFGSFYSEPLGAMFLDEDGTEKPLLGGSYGIGPGRVMAALIEQHHDESGISWPARVAPYEAARVALPGGGADG